MNKSDTDILKSIIKKYPKLTQLKYHLKKAIEELPKEPKRKYVETPSEKWLKALRENTYQFDSTWTATQCIQAIDSMISNEQDKIKKLQTKPQTNLDDLITD